jgi:hypothetical protein
MLLDVQGVCARRAGVFSGRFTTDTAAHRGAPLFEVIGIMARNRIVDTKTSRFGVRAQETRIANCEPVAEDL